MYALLYASAATAILVALVPDGWHQRVQVSIRSNAWLGSSRKWRVSHHSPLAQCQLGIAKKHSPAGEMGFADGTVSFAIYRQM